MSLRAAMQAIVLAHHRRYGYRRVTAELRRRGHVVNHRRVLRMMRSDNLLAVRYRKFVLTTDSRHDCAVYVNLAIRLTVTNMLRQAERLNSVTLRRSAHYVLQLGASAGERKTTGIAF